MYTDTEVTITSKLEEAFGEKVSSNNYAPSRTWSKEDIDSLIEYKSMGYNDRQIARKLNRTQEAIRGMWRKNKRKVVGSNIPGIEDKPKYNSMFLNDIKPKSIFDGFAGETSFYEEYSLIKNVTLISNDNDPAYATSHTYNEDAELLMAKLFGHKQKYDLVDIDTFGSPFDYIRLGIKLAKKGIIITFGEFYTKQFGENNDHIDRCYNIKSIEDLTIESLIEEVKRMGRQCLKTLNEKYIIHNKHKTNYRVYFEIETYKPSVAKPKVKKAYSKRMVASYFDLGWTMEQAQEVTKAPMSFVESVYNECQRQIGDDTDTVMKNMDARIPASSKKTESEAFVNKYIKVKNR